MELAAAVENWVRDAKGVRPRTLESYVYSLRSLAHYGLINTDEITRPNLARFFTERTAKGITTQTHRHTLSAVCALFCWLEERGDLDLMRLYDVRRLWDRLHTPPTPPARFLTASEFERFLGGAQLVHPLMELLVFVAVHTGMRLGELRALRGEDLALEGETPYVKVSREIHETKTYSSRTVPVTRAFAEGAKKRGIATRGPVFQPRPTRGEYVSEITVRRWLWAARLGAGLGRDVNYIVCRHTYASWLVQAGVSLAKVAKWLGNSFHVCFRHYAALVPGGDPDVERGFTA